MVFSVHLSVSQSVCLSVSLSVCVCRRDILEIRSEFLLHFLDGFMGRDRRKNRLEYGDDADSFENLWSFFSILNIIITRWDIPPSVLLPGESVWINVGRTSHCPHKPASSSSLAYWRRYNVLHRVLCSNWKSGCGSSWKHYWLLDLHLVTPRGTSTHRCVHPALFWAVASIFIL